MTTSLAHRPPSPASRRRPWQLAALAALACVAACSTALAHDDDGDNEGRYAIGLWGVASRSSSTVLPAATR